MLECLLYIRYTDVNSREVRTLFLLSLRACYSVSTREEHFAFIIPLFKRYIEVITREVDIAFLVCL